MLHRQLGSDRGGGGGAGGCVAMSVSIMLVDQGHGPPPGEWAAIRDRVLADLGATFEPDVVRFADGEAFNFSDSWGAKDPSVVCHVSVSPLRINRPLCRLL